MPVTTNKVDDPCQECRGMLSFPGQTTFAVEYCTDYPALERHLKCTLCPPCWGAALLHRPSRGHCWLQNLTYAGICPDCCLSTSRFR